MKEAIVHPVPIISVEVHDVPIPSPAPDQVVIKVEVAGSNVKGMPFSRNIQPQAD
jgi:NADPH2:quinone reductase